MRITLLSLLLLLAFALAGAVENQAFLGIFAETHVQKMAGMPDMMEMLITMPAGVPLPAGIFKDCDAVNFMMIGYGTGTALTEGQPLPRVQTKTTISIMLGGKAMKDNEFDMGGEE